MNTGISPGFIIIITCLLIISTSHSDGQALSDSLVRAGNRKIEANDLEGAIRDFQIVLSLQPSDNRARNGIITVLYLQGDTRKASREVDRAISGNPDYAGFYYSRGMISNQRNNYRRAIEDFTKALSLQESNLSRIYLNRGIAKLNLDDTRSALEDFTLAIDHNSNNIAAYNFRGMINYRDNKFELAIEDFDRIITINPDNDVAHYNRAMALLRSGVSSTACVNFHRSCQLGNRNACQMIIMECQ